MPDTAPQTPATAPIAPRSFQEIILRLQSYWAERGCAVLQP
ncbi:MAG: glycine--tRNA ligase subunit alpha, partial [Pseudomonadota bacterium]